MKDVYGAGVGDSMESVADAVIMVKKNLGELSDTDLTNLTQQALTLDELYGIDMNETLRGVNALMAQYGMTAQRQWTISSRAHRMVWIRPMSWVTICLSIPANLPRQVIPRPSISQLLQNGLQGGAYNPG